MPAVPARRSLVLLATAAAITLASVGPAVAAPAPAPAPAPSAPGAPSGGFGMPMDAGTRFVAQIADARTEIARTEGHLAPAFARRDELQRQWDELGGHLVVLATAAEQAAARVEESRERVSETAADVYVHGGRFRAATTLQSVAEADEVLDVSRDIHLLESLGARELDRFEEILAEQQAVADELARVGELRAGVRKDLDVAIDRATTIQRAYDEARRRLREGQDGIVRFHRLARTAASPILGPNLLTAKQMAAFVRASGNTPQLDVTLEQLAQIYLDEAAKLGVRGDVAWAQSILETGWFAFAGSMVEPEDHNFAGVGACDSCTRGYRFADARAGVRAQLQLLRIYADRRVTKGSLPDAILLPGSLRLGFRGKVQSWWDLTERWATADDYGTRLYELYDRMVTEAGARP